MVRNNKARYIFMTTDFKRDVFKATNFRHSKMRNVDDNTNIGEVVF